MNPPIRFRDVPYFSTASARALDAAAHGAAIPASLLMENAGNRMGEIILRDILATGGAPQIAVLCGPNHNGGDGLVIARFLWVHGLRPRVLLLNPPGKKLPPASAEKLGLLRRIAGHELETRFLHVRAWTPAAARLLSRSSCVVDALFGTGLSRPPEGAFARAIHAVNAHPALKIAVDLPSGLPCLLEDGPVLRSDHTLSVQGSKDFFLLPWYASHAGKIHPVHIDYPIGLAARHARIVRELAGVEPPHENPFGNKFGGGRSLICAGSARYPGAAILSSRSAIAAGCAYLTLLSPGPVPTLKLPQLMSRKTVAMVLGADDLAAHGELFAQSRQILFGPGADREESTTSFLLGLMRLRGKILIIDADGLWHLARLLESGKAPKPAAAGRVVATPHFGELLSLMKACGLCGDATSLKRDFLQLLDAFTRKTGIRVLAKEAFTHYQAPGGPLWLLARPNPFLAKAGSGDILAGRILAHISRCRDVDEAVLRALWEQSEAAERAATAYGTRAPITRLLEALP